MTSNETYYAILIDCPDQRDMNMILNPEGEEWWGRGVGKRHEKQTASLYFDQAASFIFFFPQEHYIGKREGER